MNIEKLTPTQYGIITQLCKAVQDLGAGPGLLCILGSWGDTLPESEILTMIEEYNALPNCDDNDAQSKESSCRLKLNEK